MKKLMLLFLITAFSCQHIEKTKPLAILVKCESIKLAPSGKYRYSFLIENIDFKKSVFVGNVEISIVSQEGKPIRYETFDLTNFNNGESRAVFIEAMTGTVDVHGSAGISKYGYVINDLGNSLKEEGFKEL